MRPGFGVMSELTHLCRVNAEKWSRGRVRFRNIVGMTDTPCRALCLEIDPYIKRWGADP